MSVMSGWPRVGNRPAAMYINVGQHVNHYAIPGLHQITDGPEAGVDTLSK